MPIGVNFQPVTSQPTVRSSLQFLGAALGAASKSQDDGFNLLVERFQPQVRDTLDIQSNNFGNDSETNTGSLVAAKVNRFVSEIRDSVSLQYASDIERAEQQVGVDAALIHIGRLTGEEVRLGGPTNAEVKGGDINQVTNVKVVALSPQADFTLTGEVTQAAQAAEFSILGKSGGRAATSGKFELTGANGSATFEISEKESLSAVAERINRRSADVGARAEVSGNELRIRSLDKGSNSALQFQQIGGGGVDIVGVNSAQITSISTTPGASLAGSVATTAAEAELSVEGGVGGVAEGTVTFDVVSDQGTVQVSITEDESLADVAARINSETETSGVIASVDGNDLLLRSDSVGSDATVQIQSINRSESVTTSGVNASQVSNFQINSLDVGAAETISGNVTSAATNAQLSVQISAGGQVVDSGSFRITGDLGAADIAFTGSESLTDVAARVNAQADTTGVTATVSGDDLELTTTAVGSTADVSVELLSLDHELSVAGVNNQQLSSFNVASFTDGATQVLSGSVTAAATGTELTYEGVGLLTQRVADAATFTLTGELGSAEISVGALETLSSAANKINNESLNTGVTASVSGDTLTLSTTSTGSAAVIEIDVTSGSFVTQGGDGNGNAQGTDSVAVINGETITADNNTFSLTDANGTYDFTVVAGFTGALDDVTVNSTPGQFGVTGGDGNGTATGADAVAQINGQNLVGQGNDFTVDTAVGSFDVSFEPGFTGALDAISVASTVADFTVQGGDQNNAATGVDATAILNGQALTGEGNRFQFTDNDGEYDIQFVAGFTGVLDEVGSIPGDDQFSTTGLDNQGNARGVAARASINGQELSENGGVFQIKSDQATVELTFAEGFTGEFEPITVSARIVLPGNEDADFLPFNIAEIKQAVSPLYDFASGAEARFGKEARESVSRVIDAVSELSELAIGQTSGQTSGPLTEQQATEVDSLNLSLTKAQLLTQSFKQLVVNDSRSLLNSLSSARIRADRQQLLVDLLKP